MSTNKPIDDMEQSEKLTKNRIAEHKVSDRNPDINMTSERPTKPGRYIVLDKAKGAFGPKYIADVINIDGELWASVTGLGTFNSPLRRVHPTTTVEGDSFGNYLWSKEFV